jgi:AcrR family transcriptional regulator
VSDVRDRVLDAARTLTATEGWSALTMARVAQGAGVSRQTVYAVAGDKSALAEAMIAVELAGFLRAVQAAFDGEPPLRTAVRSAVRAVFREAAASALLRAIITADQAGHSDLLPLITTRPDTVLAAATHVVGACLRPYARDAPDRRIAVTADIVVRTVLSHIMGSTAPDPAIADDLADAVVDLLQ